MQTRAISTSVRGVLGAATCSLLLMGGCNQGVRESSAAGDVADVRGDSAAAMTGAPAVPSTAAAPIAGEPGALPDSQRRTLTLDEAEDAVEDALRADAELGRFKLDADDERGGIELEGVVETEAQKARAGSIAARVAPGFTIFNELRVDAAAASRRIASVAADEAEDRIERAFETDATLRGFHLDADDEDGRVILKGTVDTEAQRRLAEETAKGLSQGVPIVNRIRVR